jgi:SAM-dependent methyltransferase
MMSDYKPDWSEDPALVSFFSKERKRPEDLYASEKRFLPWLARQTDRVLDAGCAIGGFYSIWRHYKKDIEYIGADISKSLIEAAKKLHPGIRFINTDFAEGTDFSDRFASVVAALGWIHWEPRYINAIKELWRVTDQFLFFDVRLVEQEEEERFGRQKLASTSNCESESFTPYITVAWSRFAEILLELQPKTILGYGYWGAPRDTAEGISGNVCFAAFVLEKEASGRSIGIPDVCIDMPLSFPQKLVSRVNLLPSTDLGNLVPEE